MRVILVTTCRGVARSQLHVEKHSSPFIPARSVSNRRRTTLECNGDCLYTWSLMRVILVTTCRGVARSHLPVEKHSSPVTHVANVSISRRTTLECNGDCL